MNLHPHLLLTTLLCGSALLSGCFFDDDNRFEESAAVRLEHYNDTCDSLLQSAPDGWMMPYHVVATGDTVCLFMRFYAGGVVEVAGLHPYMSGSEMLQFAYVTDTSLYRLTGEDGPTLVFDTYNNVLSCFADPHYDGVGLGGDYNFKLMEVTPQQLTLAGQRKRVEQHMMLCPTSQWEAYALLTLLVQYDGMVELPPDDEAVDDRWRELLVRIKEMAAHRTAVLEELFTCNGGQPLSPGIMQLLTDLGAYLSDTNDGKMPMAMQ